MEYKISLEQKIFEKDIDFFRDVCVYHLDNKIYRTDDSIFFRKYVHNSFLLFDFHQSIKDLACKISQKDLIPSYNFISLYGSEGLCPAHFDRPQCEYTIDVQVSCDANWPIYIKK